MKQYDAVMKQGIFFERPSEQGFLYISVHGTDGHKVLFLL
jgi:hypothetical protein